MAVQKQNKAKGRAYLSAVLQRDLLISVQKTIRHSKDLVADSNDLLERIQSHAQVPKTVRAPKRNGAEGRR